MKDGFTVSFPPSPKSIESDDENAELSDGSEVATTNFVRAISLSSLIHPTHDLRIRPVPEDFRGLPDTIFIDLARAQNLITQVCNAVEISVDGLQTLYATSESGGTAYDVFNKAKSNVFRTDLYFENMVAFSLFHKPSFGTKVQGIKDLNSLVALLASMSSISVRFHSAATGIDINLGSTSMPSSDHFHAIACRYLEEALRDIQDDAPSLETLQAMTLCVFNELIRGVRGKGWRLLGSCVRIAHELRLHVVDYDAPRSAPRSAKAAKRWVDKEEQRRCWWAIWEMDLFASTVRRAPLAIDWAMNETYLPVDDESWFSNSYRQSCFLDIRPGERWKKLKLSGNESSAAWLVVLSSIMRDAQVLARGNIQGIRCEWAGEDGVPELQQYFRNVFRKKPLAADDQKLWYLNHAFRKTIAALPRHLAYNGQKLSFGSEGVEPTQSNTGLPSTKLILGDSARYSIFLTIQLTRFHIFHHHAFSEIFSGSLFSEQPVDAPFGWTASPPPPPGATPNCEGLRNCLEAADNISAILENVPESHVKWTNPFLASTVWLAASLQVLRKVYHLGIGDEDKVKFSRLRSTYQQYAHFWGTPLSLLDNVDGLEHHLKHKRDITAEMEARVKAKRRSLRSDEPQHPPQESSPESQRSIADAQTFRGPVDPQIDNITTPDFLDIQTLLSSSQNLDHHHLLTPFYATPFLDMIPERVGNGNILEDLSLGCDQELSNNHLHPQYSVSERLADETSSFKSGAALDWFVSEFFKFP